MTILNCIDFTLSVFFLFIFIIIPSIIKINRSHTSKNVSDRKLDLVDILKSQNLKLSVLNLIEDYKKKKI